MNEHQGLAAQFEAEHHNLGRESTRCSVLCHIGWVSLFTPPTKHHEGMQPMDEHQWLVEQFEAERPHLQAVANRMLGSFRFWATDEPTAARVEPHVESQADQVLRDEALARVSAKRSFSLKMLLKSSSSPLAKRGKWEEKMS